MGAQSWAQLVNDPAPIASAAPLATSATLSDISPTPQIQMLVGPTGHNMRPGQYWLLKASGRFSNTGTPTLRLGFYYGGVAGVVLAATGDITTITLAANWPWRMEALMQCRTIGTTGTVWVTGHVLMPASLTQSQAPYTIDTAAAAAVTVDTTAQKALTVGAKWGTSSASNTVVCDQFTALALN